MSASEERVIKSSQEQAIASWINSLNQIRLDTLVEKLNQQDTNFEEALNELKDLKKFIGNPEHILGSESSKHGEIAEHMQVNISNARQAVQGLKKLYTFDGVGRLAPEDYLKNGQEIQSKFRNGLFNTVLGTNGIKTHLSKYPYFVNNGGSYDIPNDQYTQLVDLLDKYDQNPPSKLLSKNDIRIAKQIKAFLDDNGLEIGKDIHPAVIDYKDSQIYAAPNVVDREEQNIKKENKRQKASAYDESKPTLSEGAKVAGISAVMEGGVSFCIAINRKLKEKKLSDFSDDDWKDIGLDTSQGLIKGGIRGGSIYVLTNFTATPANVASAFVTASFGIAAQIKKLENGDIVEEEFIDNCLTVSLDASISAIASLAGQAVIPVPIIGAVIGNIAGELVYEQCKRYGARYAQNIIGNYNKEMSELQKQLDSKLLLLIVDIQASLKKYKSIEEFAFNTDVNLAFNGSIQLAIETGVDCSKILQTKEDIDKYFLL